MHQKLMTSLELINSIYDLNPMDMGNLRQILAFLEIKKAKIPKFDEKTQELEEKAKRWKRWS